MIVADLFNIGLKESCFPESWKLSSVFFVFKNAGEKCMAKNYRRVCFFTVISKIFGKFVKTDLLITWRYVAFFLISRMVSGHPVQQKIFWKFYLIELLELLIDVRLIKL